MSHNDIMPEAFQEWRHYKGAIYTVLDVTSEPDPDKADDHPVMVLYRAADGRKWTRTIRSFLDNFTLVKNAPPKERMAPVQGYQRGIPWSMHLDAYDAYCKRYGPQKALIEGGCRGGFGTGELDMFIPGWRDKLSEMTQLKARIAELEKEVAAARVIEVAGRTTDGQYPVLKIVSGTRTPDGLKLIVDLPEPTVAGVELTDEEREQLALIVRCDPTFIYMYLEEGSLYDVKLVRKVFELAKKHAAMLIGDKQ